MKEFIQKNHRGLFYLSWLVLGLIQSSLTELEDDEAYYWAYGQFLNWGYFDHPPMIGLLTKMGYSLFPNELGVRLLPLLLNLLSLVLIEKLIDRKNALLFYGIVLSLAVLQVAGFLAVPDTPLIFFTALFFLFYMRFLQKQSLVNIFLLGLAMALLCYSKYHAVLIVAFAFLGNIKLLGKYQTYLAFLIAILLFAPHLWWQYEHDWVSFRYHLFESNVNAYRPSFTLNYILGQLLLPGPIAGFILLPAAFLYKPVNPLERALKFTMIGIYAFFLLSSFRGKVEGNWTSPALVPLVVLAHQFLLEKYQWRQWLFKLLPVTLLLVMLARIMMIGNIVPVQLVERRYHIWKEWPAEVREKTRNLPVVFINSYQRASKYWFYTGQPAYSLNNYRGRKNNYNFWPLEDSMLGKPVYVLDIYDLDRMQDSMQTPYYKIGWKYDPVFVSFAKINVKVKPAAFKIAAGDSIKISCTFEISDHYRNYIRMDPGLKSDIRIGIFQGSEWKKDIPMRISLGELIDHPNTTIKFEPGLPAGEYYMRVAISAGEYAPTHNSNKIGLTIK